MRSIRGVLRFFVLIATLGLLLLAGAPRLSALTDDEKRQEFLNATQGENSSDTPSPTPHHHKYPAEAEATPHHHRSPTPEPDESPTPEVTTYKHHIATKEETPSPDVTPWHKHKHTTDEESPSADVTPSATPPKHHHTGEEEATPTPVHHHHPSPSKEETTSHQTEEESAPAPEHHTERPSPVKGETPIPRPAPVHTPEPPVANAPAPEPRVTPEPKAQPPAVPEPTPAPEQWGAQINIEKEGLEEQGGEVPPPPPPPVRRHWWQFFSAEPQPQYHYLTKAIRDAIDRAAVARGRWQFIVVHNSGTRQGNARIFDYYHRYVRHMPNGLAYHFVIGNGTSSGNGQIEIGNRWVKQLQGGHVHSDYLNNISLGICLVGDFNRDLPTHEQEEALTELIDYLRRRVGKIHGKPSIVKAHREINPPQWPTDCPGDRFPYAWLHQRFD